MLFLYAFSHQVQAQTDVTSLYLKNAGFDTDFNYAISTSGNIAGDVINEVSGWEKDMTATYTVAGTFAYGSGATFNGSSAIPNSGYKGSTGGALALTTGWGVSLRYSQTVTLNSGKYALVAAYYNVGTATAGSSLVGWTANGNNEATVSSVNSFPVETWITDTVQFVVLGEDVQGKIQVGFQSATGIGSANNAKILIDFVQLIYSGVDKTDLNAKISEAEQLYGDGNGNGADVLLVLINTAKTVSANADASMSEVVNATNTLIDGMLEYRLKNASKDNPLDVTHYIINPNFESSFTGWTNSEMATQTNNSFPLKDGNIYIEKWVSRGSNVPDVSIQQELTGIPNGMYKLTAATGNIQQLVDGSTQNISAIPQTGAFLFAGHESVAVDTMKDRSVDFIVVDNKVTIGFKTENGTGNWVTCDNFRLNFLGFDVNEIGELVTEQIEKAQALLAQKMQNSAKQTLENAISQAQQALAANPLVADDLLAAYTLLFDAVGAATVSIEAYNALQTAIDSALVVYADGSGKEADNLQNVITDAQNTAANLDATLDAIYESTSETYKAIFAYYLENATGTPPNVTTNPNYARGATAAFGRSIVSGITTADILERGFCWSTNPNPTIFDNRTTKYFSNNGNIYHIENLEPATVYYMRAYAISKAYAVGYGEAIKVITLPKGKVTYTLTNSVTESGEHHQRIASAMESAVDYWNNLTSIQGHQLTVYYSSGTPTAEASYGGYMKFGSGESYQRTGTALHEMDHTIGVGQHSYWYGPDSPLRAESTRGKWLGDRANAVLQFLENDNTAYMTGDGVHMWASSPSRTCLAYGINGAHEDDASELLYIGNTLITQALGEDGLPPTGGFTTPAYTFEHKDGEKYYIKNEAQSRGRDTSFLIEDESGNLVYKAMSSEEVLLNDKAAWYFSFNPSTGYYRIQNAKTDKYFTYKSSGTNGIGLVSKTTPASSESFQLMMARIDTKTGSNDNTFTKRAFWIVCPEKKLNPSCFVANANGTTSASTFSIANSATTQRWLLLNAGEVTTFEASVSALPETNAKKTIFKIINCEGGILISGRNESVENINIYSIEGQVIRNVNISESQLFVPLSTGIYIVGYQKVVVF